MSGRKNVLIRFQTVTSGDMSGNITSAVTGIQYMDNIGIQLNFTGTPTGSFAVQVSMDYTQDAQGNVTNAGNWAPLTLSPSPSAAGAANQIYIDLNQMSAPWVRVVYTASSGSGSLNAYVCGKEV